MKEIFVACLLVLPAVSIEWGCSVDEAALTGGSSTGAAGSRGQGGASIGNGGSSSGGAGMSGAAGASGGGASGGGGAQVDGGQADATNADANATADAGDARPTGDAANDATSGDGAVPYNPCPPQGTPCIIMPVGDSITAGDPTPATGGYRVPLFHLAHMNLQSITFVGAVINGPAMVDGVPFPNHHEGFSGFNIDTTQGRMGISQFFPAAITTYRPHIVLLMIGTNDVDTGENDIPGRLGLLMDSILGADRNLLLVVAQIVPQQRATPDTLNTQIQAYNAAIPGLVKTRADAGKHVAMVDMYNAFAQNANYSMAYLADRLHPNPAGYAVMADTWYAAIRQFLR
jgi:lysophospholipase L1-like esterase